MQVDEGEQWLVLRRGPIVVAANFSPVRRTVPALSATSRLLLWSTERPLDFGGFLEMAADSVVILEI